LAAFGGSLGLWSASERGHRGTRPLTPAKVVLSAFEQGGEPSLRGGTGWINSGPIDLSELRGKVVLLDFWTFCCINCHHVLPDLAKLEEKYKNELVVIGVHTAKFPAERDTDNIRRKVREYRVQHPVINDANAVIWNRFGVNSWPTLVLLDAAGKYVGSISGEGHFSELDRAIGQLVESARERGELNTTPLKFLPEMERHGDTPLLFPGKIFADTAGKRLFISDTGHNRIIQTTLVGKEPVVIGTGAEGFIDGEYNKARFNRPQGVFVDGDTLYVADTENHAIRAVDLKNRQVSTIAGTGSQSGAAPNQPESGLGPNIAISSPWDITRIPNEQALYIAMAGPHQIWRYDLTTKMIGRFAGSGVENIVDGRLLDANFAQPSGITTDGVDLYVADSEVSGIREIVPARAGNPPLVHTLVGQGLFKFGDIDGQGPRVRLQHCLGVAYDSGNVYIADTYNNKIKILHPRTRTVKAMVGGKVAGDSDKPPHFYEPGGLTVAGNTLYVADTNNHKIKVVNITTHEVDTMPIEGLTPPKAVRRPPTFPNATKLTAPKFVAKPSSSLAIAVTLTIPNTYKLNEEQPLHYLLETPEAPGALSDDANAEGGRVKPPSQSFTVAVPLAKPAAAGDALKLRFSLSAFVCSHASSLCRIQSFVWELPVEFADSGSADPLKLEAAIK
jgi:thiol-disulfide isomerase/thioredoxin